jgi:hypothetical protein
MAENDDRKRRRDRAPIRTELRIALLMLLSASGAQAFEADRTSGVVSGIEEPAARPSMVDIMLPLQLRIRLDGAYARNRRSDRALASRSELATNRFGPALRDPFAVESRVVLTRAVSKGLEVGVSWTGHNRLSESEGVDFGRQFVGALVRFVH